ncbi:MAG: hypothetical protein WBR29_11520 [Gammaproteobacteria bacterium]
MDTTEEDQPIRALEISDWPLSGLPWIAFWIKELVTWGTLEPVAAFLLARGDAVDRPQAEADARAYYDGLPRDVDANDILDPRAIRDWINQRRILPENPIIAREFAIDAKLTRPAADYLKPHVTVAPIILDDSLTWIDPAGYTVAQSVIPPDWPEQPASIDFELNVTEAVIKGQAYRQHA